MGFQVETIQNIVVIRPNGELDLHLADQLRDSIDEALDVHNSHYLIVNLGNVSYIDSSGLGVLLGRYKRLAAKGGKVLLVAPSPQVKKVLELSGLFRIMDTFLTEQEAVQRIV